MNISRKDFIKSGSSAGLATILLNDPRIKLLASLDIGPELLAKANFSCEVLRTSDLLYLKYFFFNAKRNGVWAGRKEEDYPLFVYVKLPPQHVAEELVTDSAAFSRWENISKKKSFLSGSSWLALKLLKVKKRIKLEPEQLLNWTENFELVTIDQFALKGKEHISEYKTALISLKDEFNKFQIIDEDALHKNWINNQERPWPLTKFEAPYKMFLSPISYPLELSDPAHEDPAGTNQFLRTIGEYDFLFGNEVKKHYRNKKEGIEIISPWENSLVFRMPDKTILPPRFKVVHWQPMDNADKDNCVDLLPAPIHRRELNGLTMAPEYDRDVFSDFFRISSLGSSMQLKYKNDDPGNEYALVAWEQKSRYARDNYVSVTYRAIDVFTGIKLLVSVIAERDYKFGVSFLPRLYYVAFAEKEKNYANPLVVSKVPFVKIIPKTTGAFFDPQPVPGTNNSSYAVANVNAFNGTTPVCDKFLTFDYIGIDKAGKEHPFQGKILFIPAEAYQITSGTYNYSLNGAAIAYSAGGTPVHIKHIGQLDPTKQEGYTGPPSSSDGCGSSNYKFKLIKQLNNKPVMESVLAALKTHVSQNESCYKLGIHGDMTFAKITSLKEDGQVNRDGKLETAGSEIRKDSSNATFNTKDVLLISDLNTTLFSGGTSISGDNYKDEFPLIPQMLFADVIISQIDQMEGKSTFRRVALSKAYADGNRELDENNPDNKVKLLFHLQDKIGGFFSKNYKSAGAMVNPGIDITDVSVLDQGITYNDSHNSKANTLVETDQLDRIKNVSSASIFGDMKAEILGISLLEIIEDVLPVQDLPVFSYIQQAEQSIHKIESLAREYKATVDAWKKEYDNALQEVERYTKKIQDLDNELKDLAKKTAHSWLESLIQQSGAADFYESQVNGLNALQTEYRKYYNDVLLPVRNNVKAKLTTAEPAIDVLLGKVDTINLNRLLLMVSSAPGYKPQYFKEAVKTYCIYNLLHVAKPFQLENIITEVAKLREDLDVVYLEYYTALTEGLREAANFAPIMLKQQQVQVRKQVEDTVANIPELIEKQLNGIIRKEDIMNWIIPLSRLGQLYDHYYSIYTNLKKEHYTQLTGPLQLNIVPAIDAGVVNDLEQKLIARLRDEICNFTPGHLPELIQKDFNQLRDLLIIRLRKETSGLYKNWLSEYQLLVNLATAGQRSIKEQVEQTLSGYRGVIKAVDSKFEALKADYLHYQDLLKNPQEKVRNFVSYKIAEIKAELEARKNELMVLAKGSEEYQKVEARILEIQGLINKLKEFSKQSLNYSYSTKKFRKATLGNIIQFTPQPGLTELVVNVKYEIEFDISNFTTPTIAKQSYVTDSRLSNFKIGLLQLLYIDFERVGFITGSEVKDDFSVRIRDVQFTGFLNFVQAFQEYLKTISNNLVFDINATGAQVGYGFSIPDFTAGYFNFFNLSLSGLLTLPFDPEKSLQLRFGFGSPLNKFGLTVSGIFGGQGYFNLIAEPRRGIVGMEMALEFGAIFNLNLGVAYGNACLVGGVYISKYLKKYELRAYILCAGRFSVLGLFSANISFYLGLEGNSHVLKGVCRVTVSKRFSRFFEISVGCTMEKTLKGAESANTSERFVLIEEQPGLAGSGLSIADSNLTVDRQLFYQDEKIYFVIALPDEPQQVSITLRRRGVATAAEEKNLEIHQNAGCQGYLGYVSMDLSAYDESGEYELHILVAGRRILERTFTVINPEKERAGKAKQPKQNISSRAYYASYYVPE